MERDVLTGTKLNQAKDNASDEAVEALLKKAQEQLDRNIGGERSAGGNYGNADSTEIKYKAERERAQRERESKALKEKEELERIKKEQEKLARDVAERKAKEQEKRDAAERKAKEQERIRRNEIEKKKALQEKKERDKLINEKAEKERVGKELASYDKNADTTRPSNMPKVYPSPEAGGDTRRLDILVNGSSGTGGADRTGGAINKAIDESAAALALEDEVIVDNSVPAPIRKEGITVGDIIGGILEFVWTIFKLAVVISIVTGIVGFFLSREMLIRGRNGNLKSLDDMQITQTIKSNKDSEDAEVKEWIKAAKPEKLTLESDDGYILVARRIIANKDKDNWVVLMHGYNGSMEDVYDIAKKYAEKGYNVLMPDLRASGESEGSFIGMGWLDRLDVINWIDVIIADNPSAKIILHGEDMGADTALMISGEPIKSNIKGIVAEGAYTSAWEVLQKEFKLRHEKWPVFPMMEMINPVAKLWGGYSLREASAVKQVEKTAVPILLIQGGQDTYVTEDMANELNQSIASSHELVVIPSGTHETCRYADPDTYYNKVFDFTNAHTN
ncbi:MAG: alpha/beta fold hydrolase [Lachnospiraceae bacterium]|nr:alpha/beta fold hydrolase [Lachnospiraceae bacterium]